MLRRQHSQGYTYKPAELCIKIDSEETYDISDAKGKALLSKYNITQVPTVILSSDVNVYPSSAALKQFFLL